MGISTPPQQSLSSQTELSTSCTFIHHKHPRQPPMQVTDILIIAEVVVVALELLSTADHSLVYLLLHRFAFAVGKNCWNIRCKFLRNRCRRLQRSFALVVHVVISHWDARQHRLQDRCRLRCPMLYRQNGNPCHLRQFCISSCLPTLHATSCSSDQGACWALSSGLYPQQATYLSWPDAS